MIKAISTFAVVSALLVGQAYAAGSYAGTWSGQLSSGTPVTVVIPEGVESGAPASYSYDGQDQGMMTPVMQGKKIRLNNSSNANYLLVGPVKGDKLPYFWTDGSHKASAVLSRQ